MKRIKLLNKFIDALYILLIFSVTSIALIPVLIAFGIEIELPTEFDSDGFAIWVFFVLELFFYLLFLIGIFFLRRVARNLIETNPFMEQVIENLNKSGNYMIFAGSLSMADTAMQWIFKLVTGTLFIGYDTDLFLPIFVIIIGLFFKIQSNALAVARKNKHELELVV